MRQRRAREAIAGVDARQLVGRERSTPPAEVRRPVERRVVMHDDDAVPRQADVELEAVGAERQAVVERGDACSPARARCRRDARTPADAAEAKKG